MIDVGSLSSLLGTVTVQRGLDYVRRGAVSGVELTEDPLNLRGQVAGTRPQPYRVTVDLTMAGARVVALTGICSCPVAMNCKHVAALVVAGLSRRRSPSPTVAAWEQWLTPLVAAAAEPDGELQPALLFELQPAPGPPTWSAPAGRTAGRAGGRFAAGAVAGVGARTGTGGGIASGAPVPPQPAADRLAIRPVQRGAGGRWVRSGIGWSTLGYAAAGMPAVALEWLQALLALADGAGRRYYTAAASWIELGDVRSTAFWDLLFRAGEVGVALIGSDKAQRPVVLEPEPAELVLDLVRSGSDLLVAAQVVAPGAPAGLPAGSGLVIGDPPRAVVTWPAEDGDRPLKERGLRLRRFSAAPPGRLVALLEAGPQLVPAAEQERFSSRYLPALRHRVAVVSHDRSFDLPPPRPPELWLTVDLLPAHRVQLQWRWRYPDVDREDELHPGGRVAAHRDVAVEHRILAEAPAAVSRLTDAVAGGRLIGDVTLADMQCVLFFADVLPELEAWPALHLDVRGSADYRAADNPPVIGISGQPADGRDWFDLEITVTVDGEPVPLREIFLALAAGQQHLILASGTYFPLQASVFDQLRRLIDEASLLQDADAKALRVSRFQAGWWNELQALGVVDEQAAHWHRQISSLTDGASMARQQRPAGFAAELRPYQQDGFDWLCFLFDAGLGGILADDMGLGKTIQALALICRAVARPAGCPPFLVVAPTSVVGNWKSEAGRFAPHLRVAAVTETSARAGVPLSAVAADADVVITSYALFRLEFDGYAGQEWSGLILDEAQFVKNSQSLVFKNAKMLPAPFKLAITGTPMENNLMELWALFSIVAPGLFPGPARFTEYYRTPIEKLGDQDKLAVLRRRIRPLMLRRNKDQVIADLPPKQEQVLELELNPRHQKVYQTHLQRERKKVLGLIGDLDRNRFTIFRSLTLLRQLSLDASLVDEKYAGVPSTKLDALMELLDDVVAEGHRVLVFSQFTSFLGKVRGRLADAGIDHCYLDGRTRRRPEVLERFATGAAPVFLISLKAGGVGLNLTEADYCILLDPWWNPATEAQAVDRSHRIGQTRTVMVYRLVAKGTIEEKVMALKAGKAALFAGVMADDATGRAALTADDIRDLFT